MGKPIALSNHYDVIILDVNLPKMNGLYFEKGVNRPDSSKYRGAY
jgi:DNA-binding response OmpR family regulator